MNTTSTASQTRQYSQMIRIINGLRAVGACFAGSSYKSYDQDLGCEVYRVHPDSSYPHQAHIKRFTSQRELLSWIKASKEAQAFNAKNPPVEGYTHMMGVQYDPSDNSYYADFVG